VLDGVSAEIPPQSFTGLVGPNGCGKTTLLQVILGLIRPEAGSVKVLGADPARCPLVRRRIGYLAQIPRYDPLFPVSAADVVEMGALARMADRTVRGSPVHARRRPARADAREASMQALELIGLERLATVPFGRLSGGQRQLVLLARAIAGNPRLLLLDEPLTGLDQKRRAGFYPLVDRLRHETGLTVVAVCHDFRALLPHAERLLCLDGGLHEHREAGSPAPGRAAPDTQECCLVDAVFQGRFPAG
jgi:zinc transport system ATP-binding protein